MLDTLTSIQNTLTNLGPLNLLLHNSTRKRKTNVQETSCMHMHKHLLMNTQSNSQVSHQSISFSFLSEAFTVLKDFQIFLTKQMSNFFPTLVEQGFALVYIYDILLLSNSKDHMFQLIEQLHIISTKNNTKLAPEKSFFMLFKVKFLGHEIVYNTIKPIHSKIAAILKILSPTGNVALMIASNERFF